ncbi:UNVERIFIED_CONTAM: hypothetical protein FKN15_042842 [Acipenser sinensis]
MDRNALAELLQALESRRDAEERRREERYTALIERWESSSAIRLLLQHLKAFEPVQCCLWCHAAPEPWYLGASTPLVWHFTQHTRSPQGFSVPQ